MDARLKLEEGWTTLFLLWAMILVAALALNQADLIDGLQIIPLTGSLAVLAGLLLAKSRFQSRTAHLFSFVYGLFVVSWLVASILPAEETWRVRVIEIFTRQADWFEKAFNGGTSRDGLIFVIQTSFIYWLLGYTGAWFTFRQSRVWLAVVPTGIVLLSVVYYYNGPKLLGLYLATYTLLALIYVARTHLADQEKKWRSGRVRFDTGIHFDFMRSALLAALLALMLAWVMPSLSASAAVGDALGGTRGPWRQFQDNWTRLFSSLRSYGSGVSDPYQDTLVLGGPRNVGNTPIMDVYVGGRLPYAYWEAIAYDTYENGRWTAQFVEDPVLHFPDDGDLNIPLSAGREVITQTVVNYLPNSSFLYAAPQMVSTDRQIVIEGASDPTGRLLVSSVRSRYVLRQGDQYNVESRFSLADAEGLRSAPTDYPDWIQQYYLTVPDTITPETIQLASDITSQFNNPFDKAIAVRDYLRENVTYNDQIPAPPEAVDPVHYTLFISREGYCNYYASAMAMMLRSQGIPSRVVSGYAQGEYDDKTHSYRIRASNAHTWVEVYFQRYGWIQFEPTASIPVYNRPETANEGGGDNFASPVFGGPDRSDLLPEENFEDFDPGALDSGELTPPINEQTSLLDRLPSWQVIGAIVLVLIAGLTLFGANEINKRVEKDVERSYSRLGNWGRWLGLSLQPTHTPYERADMITAVVPESGPPVRNLTQQFVRKQFSPAHDMDDTFDPRTEWRVLRPLLLRQSVINWWEKWRHPQRKKDRFDRWR